MEQRTDATGKVTIKWPEAGMYWINVTPNAPRPEGEGEGLRPQPGAQAGAPRPEGGPQGMRGVPSGRRVSYTTTLEVLAP